MNRIPISRRALLQAGVVAAGGAAFAGAPSLRGLAGSPAHDDRRNVRLEAKPGTTRLLGADGPQTAVWTYEGTVPGPVIRVRQGNRLRLDVLNGLSQPTSLHPHGIRLPNDQDGVPPLTQAPIAPGARFAQTFAVPDAGTFWYHPHIHSAEQVGRGLSGVLVVEERDPVAVDRDVVWLLDDWRLDQDGQITGDFGHFHDLSHAGRWGNVRTVNGRRAHTDVVKAGERVRLRLVNAANARIFALALKGAEGWLMAVDGQPLGRARTLTEPLLLGPGMRADLFVDIAEEGTVVLVDRIEDTPVPLAMLRTAGTVSGLAGSGTPDPLPANPVPEPAAEPQVHHRFVLSGGAMGGMAGATVGDTYQDVRALARRGLFWAINGVVPMTGEGHGHGEPMVTLARGATAVFALENATAWPHPIHLHGHSFRVISVNGQRPERPEMRDTVLLLPRETADIAFVADNPGDWMFHCHILEHQVSGMNGFVRVA